MKYFTKEELTCSHCGASDIDAPFMEKVEALREELGFPFPVNSAYRCRNHAIEARKKVPGAHTTGNAIDIGVSGEQALRLVEAAIKSGEFGGIGINQKGKNRFIHLDDIENTPERPRPWLWSY